MIAAGLPEQSSVVSSGSPTHPQRDGRASEMFVNGAAEAERALAAPTEHHEVALFTLNCIQIDLHGWAFVDLDAKPQTHVANILSDLPFHERNPVGWPPGGKRGMLRKGQPCWFEGMNDQQLGFPCIGKLRCPVQGPILCSCSRPASSGKTCPPGWACAA